MCQRVHAGGGGQSRRHAHHEIGIVNGHAGRTTPVNNSHFDLAGRIGDNAKARHFRGCARSGVHRHIGRERLGGFVHPLIVMDFTAVSGQKTHSLAAVMRTAAAQGHNAVTAFGSVHGKCRVHIFVCGVGHGLIKNGVRHAGGIKNVRNLLENTSLDDTLIRDDERLFAADVLQTAGNLAGTASTHKRDVGDEERSDLAKMHCLDIHTFASRRLFARRQNAFSCCLKNI